MSDQHGFTAGTPSDSKGNTWTQAVQRDGAAIVRCTIFYCHAPSVGSGHTFSIGSATAPSIYVLAFSGDTASPLDQVASTYTEGAPASTGSITPSQDNELVIAACSVWQPNGSDLSVNGGFTLVDQISGLSGQRIGGAVARLIQTSAASANPAFSTSASSFWFAAAIASFKPGGGGGGGSVLSQRYYREQIARQAA